MLLLDADNQPLRNPEPLFDAEAFRTTGGLFWPDWCASSNLMAHGSAMMCGAQQCRTSAPRLPRTQDLIRHGRIDNTF